MKRQGHDAIMRGKVKKLNPTFSKKRGSTWAESESKNRRGKAGTRDTSIPRRKFSERGKNRGGGGTRNYTSEFQARD